MGLLSAFPMEPTSQTVHGLGAKLPEFRMIPMALRTHTQPSDGSGRPPPPPQLTSYCLIFIARKFKGTPGDFTQVLAAGWFLIVALANEAGGGLPSPEPGRLQRGHQGGLSLAVTPVSEHFPGPSTVPSSAVGSF